MIKIQSIEKMEGFALTCRFNNNMVKRLDVYPLIQNHKELNGIEKLMDCAVFSKARIGKMGEIVWDKIIKIANNGEESIWDYDISPEFAYENSKEV